MSNVLSDLKHGVRVLLRTPLFTICTIAALAIGIGATTALFSVVHALLIRPLPYKDADSLVVMWEHNLPRNRPRNVISPANFLAVARAQPIVRRHGGIHAEPRDADRRGEPQELATIVVIGEHPRHARRGADARARICVSGEDREDAPRTMILSHAAWLRQFGGEQPRIGRNGHDQRRARHGRSASCRAASKSSACPPTSTCRIQLAAAGAVFAAAA